MLYGHPINMTLPSLIPMLLQVVVLQPILLIIVAISMQVVLVVLVLVLLPVPKEPIASQASPRPTAPTMPQ